MKYNRSVYDGNMAFSYVIDEKFKTSSLIIRFITPLDGGKAADNAMGICILSDSCKKYNSIAKMNEKCSSLYGASVNSGVRKLGDLQILNFSASWINNRYAIDGEDITGEMLDIVCNCIFEPNAQNGKFEDESFKITKNELLDKIESEINNKRGYAISRASASAFKNEPAENPCYGTKEAAEAADPESAFAAYRNLIETAQIEICFIASEENPAVQERLMQEFSKIKRVSPDNTFRSLSPSKNVSERVSVEFDVNQSKMVLVFKTDFADRYALKIMNMIFGETPVSKLFMNVREKLSLCYYCASRISYSKGAVIVDSGVEKENIQKAEEEILRQLDEIKNGNFTDDEINSALLSVDNALASIGDTPSSYSSWYFDCLCRDEFLTPEQVMEKYKAVSRDDIINAAKSLKLDTVYLMLNKEDKE